MSPWIKWLRCPHGFPRTHFMLWHQWLKPDHDWLVVLNQQFSLPICAMRVFFFCGFGRGNRVAVGWGIAVDPTKWKGGDGDHNTLCESCADGRRVAGQMWRSFGSSGLSVLGRPGPLGASGDRAQAFCGGADAFSLVSAKEKALAAANRTKHNALARLCGRLQPNCFGLCYAGTTCTWGTTWTTRNVCLSWRRIFPNTSAINRTPGVLTMGSTFAVKISSLSCWQTVSVSSSSFSHCWSPGWAAPQTVSRCGRRQSKSTPSAWGFSRPRRSRNAFHGSLKSSGRQTLSCVSEYA